MPIYRFGTEEQKREWLPALCAGEQLAAFGLTEPGGGSDGRRNADHRPARRRRVGHQRLQGVHHQLRHRHHLAGHGRRDHRRPRRRRQGDLRDHGARRARPGFTVGGRRTRRSAGAPRTPSELFFDDVPRAGGEPARPAGPRLRPVPAAPWTRAGSRSPRWPSGWPRAASMSALRVRRASASRSARPIGEYQAIQFKIADMEARGHTARLAWYDAAARMAAGAAVQEGGGHRQADRLRTPRWTTPGTRPRSSAATGS